MATLSVFMGFGGVTDTSVTLRARASASANIDFEYSTDSGLAGSVISSGGSVSSTTDFTGGDTLNGLRPNTKYHICPRIDGVRAYSAPYPSVTTYPPVGVDAEVRIVHGSCITSGSHATIFNAAAAESPTAVGFLGDHNYSAADSSLAQTRASFAAGFSGQFLSALIKAFPFLWQYDDHDGGGNNLNGDQPLLSEAIQAFREYHPLYTQPNPTGGTWQYVDIANVGVWVLDPRTQREGTKSRFPSSGTKVPDTGSSGSDLYLKSADSPSASDDAYNGDFAAITTTSGIFYRRVLDYIASTRRVILSASVPGTFTGYFIRRASGLDMNAIANGQLDWFITTMLASQRRWKAVMSGVVLNPTDTVDTDTFGGWDGDGIEWKYIRQELASVSDIVALSADRHYCGLDDGRNAVWPELTASPFNQTNVSLGGSWSHGTYGAGRAYGLSVFGPNYATLRARDAVGADAAGISPLTIPHSRLNLTPVSWLAV